MPESIQHFELIGRMISYIESHVSNTDSLSVLSDLPTNIGGERPPKIDGFTPDLYAVDVPFSQMIIGEAKTERDLETDHSRLQIITFLSYLNRHGRGMFILSVPWQISAAAQRMLRNIVSRERKVLGVEVILLDETREYRTR